MVKGVKFARKLLWKIVRGRISLRRRKNNNYNNKSSKLILMISILFKNNNNKNSKNINVKKRG